MGISGMGNDGYGIHDPLAPAITLTVGYNSVALILLPGDDIENLHLQSLVGGLYHNVSGT